MRMLSQRLRVSVLLNLVIVGLAWSSSARRAFLVTGANKGQGLALCERILSEHDDTHVFLCSRNFERGKEASQNLPQDRVNVIELDVTSEASVQAAVKKVKEILGDGKLEGIVSNHGILWGYSLQELVDVCTIGVKRVLDAFVPLLNPKGGKVVVVSSGLSPLMNQFSTHGETLLEAKDWDTIDKLLHKCLETDGDGEKLELIGFSGGPFAESAPDFHKYGLAKMFADSYMLVLARLHPSLEINSCDPGLVYTDLIQDIPRYVGKTREETGAKSPHEAVEVHMRLLFDGDNRGNGKFYAINKEGKLMSSGIDKRPDV